MYISLFFLFGPGGLGKLGMGPSGTLLEEQGSINLVEKSGHKGPVVRPRCSGPGRARTQIPFTKSFIHVPHHIISYKECLHFSHNLLACFLWSNN